MKQRKDEFKIAQEKDQTEQVKIVFFLNRIINQSSFVLKIQLQLRSQQHQIQQFQARQQKQVEELQQKQAHVSNSFLYFCFLF